jgi:hypothetical protein
MYILIEEREKYDSCSDYVNCTYSNIGISDSLSDLLEYCREKYSLSDAEYKELCKYKSVDDVYDKYRCSVNLIINVINYI